MTEATKNAPFGAGFRPSNLGIEWNAENQLKKVLKNAATIATFAYDPAGRRVEKVAGGTTTTFTYDEEDILRETAGATTTYYVHGPGIDEPLGKEISGSLTYYHADALGSILKMTNGTGSVAHEYRYDAFGRIDTGSTQGGYSFTGREWDPEIWLYYYRARYYDPTIGRFLSEDPIGLKGGLNLQGYVTNNPANLIDPTGTAWLIPAIILALAYVFNNPTNANVTEGPTVSPIVDNGILTLAILAGASVCYGRAPGPVDGPDWGEQETPEQPDGPLPGDFDRYMEIFDEVWDERTDESGFKSTDFGPDGSHAANQEEAERNTQNFYDEIARRFRERYGRNPP